ncbi:hypothetical protein OK074_8973, partial [Actinobacteria bacterium OK074]
APTPPSPRPSTDVLTALTDTVTAVTSAVREQVVQPVTGGLSAAGLGDAVRPIGDLVTVVTQVVADVVAALPSTVSTWPVVSVLPVVLPGWTGLPWLPWLPGLSWPPDSPVQAQPVPTAPQSSVGGAVEHRAVEPAAATVAYGPRVTASGPGAGADGSVPRAAQGPRLVRMPMQQNDSDPGGTPGNQSAVDNGTPRHGDGHAVTFFHEAPTALVRGAAAVVTADGTSDRHRDIPVFPG